MSQALADEVLDRCVDAFVTDASRDRRIALVVASLEIRFCGSVDTGLIRTEVEAAFAAFAAARVHEFVPILVESRVRSRLAADPARLTPTPSNPTSREGSSS